MFESVQKIQRLLTACLLLGLAQIGLCQLDPSQPPAAPLDAWSDQQAELLLSEGRALLQAGDFELAERRLLEAVQITKINYGLQSPRQIQPLQVLIEAQLARGDWDAAESQLDYFEWINGKNLRSNFGEFLQGNAALSKVLLAASADERNPYSVRYLIDSKNLNWKAVTAIESVYGKDSPVLLPWLYRIVLTHYYQSTLVRRRGYTSFAYHTDGNRMISSWSLSRSESLRMSYRIGRDLLQRIGDIQTANQGSTEALALTALYRADWELLFGRHDSALEHYQQAYAGLLDSGLDRSTVDRFFARPVALPEPTLKLSVDAFSEDLEESDELRFTAWSPLYPAVAQPRAQGAWNARAGDDYSARARFDLVPLQIADGMSDGMSDGMTDGTTGFGLSMENLEILATAPSNDRVAAQALQEVSLLPFRPRLVDGEPAVLENVELEYRFPAQAELMTRNESNSNNSESIAGDWSEQQ